MTEMLVKLERQGLIVRKQDEKDQRVLHIFLTDEGKAASAASDLVADKLIETLFSCLSAEEVRLMLGLTQKICQGIDLSAEEDSSHYHHQNHHGWGQ
jgi:DNA-binding MarR family transcriptional regulator